MEKNIAHIPFRETQGPEVAILLYLWPLWLIERFTLSAANATENQR